ncbi:hypothetical protein [Candidatus Entotheonella palauensis]|uniref:hypothetical protein n=1 Tax=Candidatus Entotheonella palauensis TaxID=93172 RepID=UPI000B7F1B6E|nr:hypothetical protein [Candidatus Entotheonella palauensis]
MTHTTLQAVFALAAAALSLGVAIYGFALAPRHVVHRIFAVVMACLALMQLGTGLNTQLMYGEHLRLLASAALPGLALLLSVCFARFNPREHVRAWQWAIPIALAVPLGLAMLQPMHAPLNWAGYGFYLLTLCSIH